MHQICWSIQSRQEDNGDFLRLVILLQDHSRIETTDIGHHHVEQDQIGMFLLGHLNTRGTIIGRTNLEFLIGQKNLQQQNIADDIIHYKYLILTSVDFGF